jgi:hypothetical protein
MQHLAFVSCLWWWSFLCVLVSSGRAFSGKHSCPIVMISFPRHLAVHVIQSFRCRKPAFLPKFLDDVLARFRSSWWLGSFGYELGFFEFLGYGRQYLVYGGLQLVFLAFYFEFHFSYFHLDSYWGFALWFGHFFTLLHIVLCILLMHNT